MLSKFSPKSLILSFYRIFHILTISNFTTLFLAAYEQVVTASDSALNVNKFHINFNAFIDTSNLGF